MMAAFATIGTMCCSISVVLINTGFFMRPLNDEFGWSRGDVALALSVAAIVMALANPIMGDLLDRFGTRRLLVFSLATYGIATALVPFFVDLAGLTGLYIGFAVLSAFGAGSTIVGYIRLLGGWFSGPMLKSRGLAMGCCSSGVVLGAAISGPLVIFLIDHFGWKGGFWGLSLLPLLVGLPVTALFVRDAPGMEKTENARADLPGMTMAEVFRSRPFWIMTAMVLLISSCLQGMAIHIAPFLSDAGLSESALAMITMFNALIAIPARLIAGHLFDKFFAPRVAIVVFLLPALGALLMAVHPVLLIGLMGSVLLAVGQGAESDYIGYLVSRYFGMRNTGRIFGLVYGIFMLGIALGPFMFGKAYDLWGDYTVPFAWATVGLTLLCVLMLFLPRFRED